jgi:hypothetical protein
LAGTIVVRVQSEDFLEAVEALLVIVDAQSQIPPGGFGLGVLKDNFAEQCAATGPITCSDCCNAFT